MTHAAAVAQYDPVQRQPGLVPGAHRHAAPAQDNEGLSQADQCPVWPKQGLVPTWERMETTGCLLKHVQGDGKMTISTLCKGFILLNGGGRVN